MSPFLADHVEGFLAVVAAGGAKESTVKVYRDLCLRYTAKHNLITNDLVREYLGGIRNNKHWNSARQMLTRFAKYLLDLGVEGVSPITLPYRSQPERKLPPATVRLTPDIIDQVLAIYPKSTRRETVIIKTFLAMIQEIGLTYEQGFALRGVKGELYKPFGNPVLVVKELGGQKRVLPLTHEGLRAYQAYLREIKGTPLSRQEMRVHLSRLVSKVLDRPVTVTKLDTLLNFRMRVYYPTFIGCKDWLTHTTVKITIKEAQSVSAHQASLTTTVPQVTLPGRRRAVDRGISPSP